ncbi:protein PIN-LIKES 3-like isoform X2 [Phoenix dactylifera]|uniref:Protein PIN-LIKES 3-like isoform X2 n=1 Tax=Phoenix dactylifera TaxID=42345 RepID=A0A8B8J3G8_PHODC|nr:protein PIN-LIKES 3-like isoform X2 [Phoenix dactylifera]
MGFLELFITATVPVMNVLLVTGVGSFLATSNVGILSEDARKHLNNVVFFVFNPALVSTNLARTITMESMVLLWFMPINILLTFIVGSLFGWLVIQITRAPTNLRGLILGCCAAGNLGNMLLIIVPAICKEKGSPFGASDVCHTYGLAYASLSMAIGAIFLWSYVYNIVRVSSGAAKGKMNTNFHPHRMEFPEGSTRLFPGSCTDGAITTYNCSTSSHYADESTLPLSRSNESSTMKVPFSVKARKLLSTLLGVIDLKKLFAPSTIGVIVGFVIGVIPQIRKAMIGEGAPLRVIQESAALLGDGAIPTLTLIMGGNLIKGLRSSGIRLSIIIGVIVVRYIMLPLVGIVVIKVAIRLGLVHSDPLYQFILLVQYALPPAMNIGTITQLFGAGESECSVIFLWAYALASFSLTLWSTFFMWLVS